MKKESKISVVHFEKKDLEKIFFARRSIHTVYFRVTHKRRRAFLRSKSFDEMISLNLDYSDELYNNVVEKDQKIIWRIIEKVRNENCGEFDLDMFKVYYKKYSTNALTFVNERLVQGFIKGLSNEGLSLFAELIEKNRNKLSLEYLMKLINELSPDGKLYSKLDKFIGYKHSFIVMFSHMLKYFKMDEIVDGKWAQFDNIQEFKKEKKKLRELFYDTYIPLIDWIDGEDEMSQAAYSIARDETMIDIVDGHIVNDEEELSKIMDHLKKFYFDVKSEFVAEMK